MSIFSNLLNMLPDADHLLSLKPEELAGPLLLSLEGRERMTPTGVIEFEGLSAAIQEKSDIKYPNGCHDDVLFALMEAWQWLVSKVLVAPRPTKLAGSTVLSTTTTYFVTRRGRSIKTLEDFKNYRKNNSTM